MSTAVAADGRELDTSKKMIWAGRVISALPALMLISSAAMKLSHAPGMADQMEGKLGWPGSSLTTLGIVELACVALFVVPRTALIGAVLVTAYLGGAVAAHVRVADAFLIPVVLGVLVWTGLALRDGRLRAAILGGTR